MDKERILATEAQAKAVQEIGFLNQFIEPTSPSDAAKQLGQPANLVHHHVQRHLELGLLKEVMRENGKVFYQLTARLFKVPHDLLPPGDPDNQVARELDLIQRCFLKAYERSDRINHEDPNFSHFGFVFKDDPEPWLAQPGDMLEPHATHFQARTLALTPQSYQRLVRQIADLITGAEYESNKPEADLCSLVFLGMDGELQAGAGNSHYTSSFVPPLKESP